MPSLGTLPVESDALPLYGRPPNRATCFRPCSRETEATHSPYRGNPLPTHTLPALTVAIRFPHAHGPYCSNPLPTRTLPLLWQSVAHTHTVGRDRARMLAAYFICLPCTAVTGTLAPAPLPATLPVFTPEASVPHGLSLLTSVASSTLAGPSAGVEAPRQVAANPTSGLQGRGPFNPVALLPTKLVKKILDLEFVEMSDITLDDLPTPGPGQPPLPARPPIQDITTWVEKFSLMAAILATRFPEKAPELFAYQASIVRAERNFEGRRWVTYDRCYRREALATKDLNWSAPNLRLYYGAR